MENMVHDFHDIWSCKFHPNQCDLCHKENAEKYGDYQEAILAEKEKFYTDDYLDSRETIEDAVILVQAVILVMQI